MLNSLCFAGSLRSCQRCSNRFEYLVQVPRFCTLITEVFPATRKMERKEKISAEIVSKFCWVCAITRPGVRTSHSGQTGCVTGFRPSRHSRTWAVRISTGQNGTRLIKMAREEIGLQPRSKSILCHAQQDFETISPEVFLLSIFCVPGKTSVIGVALLQSTKNTLLIYFLVSFPRCL